MTERDTWDEMVDRPAHYDGDECMRFLEGAKWGRVGCLFNIGKYLWRMGAKGNAVQDAQKALWYAKRLRDQPYGYVAKDELAKLKTCAHRGFVAVASEDEAPVKAVVYEVFKALPLLIGDHVSIEKDEVPS